MSEIAAQSYEQPTSLLAIASSSPQPVRGLELLEEIILGIVMHISRTDVTRIVRVSRAFWRIAIPLIWRNLEEVECNGHLCHLLQIGEEDSVRNEDEEEDQPSVVGSCNVATNLRRSTLDIHGHIIRNLTLVLWNEGDPFGLIDVLDSMGARGATRILPSLEELCVLVFEISGVQDRISRALQVLISPTINAVEINFDTYSVDEHDIVDNVHAFISLLDLLDQLQLESLRVSCTDALLCTSDTVSAKIGAVISRQSTLASVALSELCTNDCLLFLEVARLPRLETVYLELPQFSGTYPPHDPKHYCPRSPASCDQEPAFPLLCHLMAEACPEDASRLLLAVTSENLRIVELNLVPSVSSTTFGQTLAGIGRFQLLQNLRMKFADIQGTWGGLSPILACRSIENISISGGSLAAEVGNRELRSMAEAWPLLRSLTVVESGRENATLAGLGVFALLCPCLESITIAIDARETLHTESFEAVGTNVTYIRFPELVMGEREHEVAEFIRRMWPNHLCEPGNLCFPG